MKLIQYGYTSINSDAEDKIASQSTFFLLFQRDLPRWLSHDIPPIKALLQGLMRRLQTNQTASLPTSGEMAVKRMFDGIEAITRVIYPLLFLGMWGFDHYNYRCNFQNRYQMSLRDFLLGIPQNYHYENVALAANLGGDIAAIQDWSYWPWTWIVASALLSGILFTARSRPRELAIFYQMDSKEPRSVYQQFQQDFIASFPYISTYYWQLYRWKNRLIQTDYRQAHDYSFLTIDSDLDSDTLDELEKIVISLNHRGYFARWLAVQALGDIAYSRRDKMQEFAVQELMKAAQKNPFIHYQLWSSGHSKNIFAHFLGYFVVTPVQLFIRLRLWSLLVTKLIGLIRFLHDQHQCQNGGNTWADSAAGNYVCTPCDWPFMDYRPRRGYAIQGQDCMNALMSSSRSFAEIYSKLSALQNHGPFTSVDFSRQNWTAWPVENWRNMITLLNTSAFYTITTLNLSRPIMDIFPVPSPYLDILADYLPFSSIRYLDLSGVQLTSANTPQFFSGLYNNSQIQYLGFSQSGLTDSILLPLVGQLPAMVSLRSLILAGNQLTGVTFNRLQNVSHSLSELDFSDNALTAADIDTFYLNRTALQILQLSGADLRGGLLNNFITSLYNSSLRTLMMERCGITDSLAINLLTGIAGSILQNLSLAGNRIGYSALSAFAPLLNLTHLIYFNLNDNNIDDSALMALANALALNHSLQQLLLAGNRFSVTGFANLTASLAGSSVRSLSVSRVTGLGNSAGTVLRQLPSDRFSLTQLDLSAIGMTTEGASDLLPYLADTSLTDLDLQGNSFTGDMADALKKAFNHTALKSLNLRATGVSAQSLMASWPLLMNSSVETLDVSQNPLGDQAAASLAENLITDVPNLASTLSSLTRNRDGERAISRASAATPLQQLLWEEDMALTDVGVHAVCEALASTHITPTQLSMGGLNRLDSRISGCPFYRGEASFSSAARHSPSVSWPLLILFLGLASSNSSISSHFFVGIAAMIGGMLGGLPGMLLGAVASYQTSLFYGIPGRQKNRQNDLSGFGLTPHQ